MSDDLAQKIREGIMDGWSSDHPCLDGYIAIKAAEHIEALEMLIQEMREALQDARDMVWPMELNDRTMAVLRILDAALSKAKSQQEGETE